MGKIKPVGFRFQKFSKKQKQVLTWWLPESGVSKANGIIADGAVRSGKTICMALGFIMWSMDSFSNQNFAMCGKSIGTFKRNVLIPLKSMLVSRGYHCLENRGDNMLEVRKGNIRNYYYIFGGKDERSQDLIQGITLAGLLMDEVALMPRSFVQQAEARCSVENAKIWYNCNPEGPLHWFKTDRVDQAKEQGLLHLHFLMDDNLSLSEETKERFHNRFAGSPVFFRRFILGEWCAAEGMIYPMYAKAKEPRFSGIGSEYAISIDYGTLNAFAALIWAKDGDIWHITDEYRYSGRDEMVLKTDNEYLQDMIDFAHRCIPSQALQREIASGGIETIIDPSAASFIALLRQDKMFRARKAKNEVLDGIRDAAVCLQNGFVKISDECAEMDKEFSSYVWDAENQAEDKPVKVNDHLMDAFRYFVRTKRLVRREKEYKSPLYG